MRFVSSSTDVPITTVVVVVIATRQEMKISHRLHPFNANGIIIMRQFETENRVERYRITAFPGLKESSMLSPSSLLPTTTTTSTNYNDFSRCAKCNNRTNINKCKRCFGGYISPLFSFLLIAFYHFNGMETGSLVIGN